MSNRVEYRFRCKKKSSYVNIVQTSVSISRLRELIMKQENLDQQLDITLVIKNAQTGKTYKDQSEIIHRSTSVIVSRLPVSSLDEKAPVTEEEQKSEQVITQTPITPFDEQDMQIEREQKNFFYGQKEMPRSFILRPTRCKVILPYGEVACFQRTDEPPLSETRWSLEDLQRWLCPICHRILVRATSTPCCPGTAYCNTCIAEALLADDHQKCPNCNRVNISPLDLREERQLREELAEWQRYDPQKLKGSEEYQRIKNSRRDDAYKEDKNSNRDRDRDNFMDDPPRDNYYHPAHHQRDDSRKYDREDRQWRGENRYPSDRDNYRKREREFRDRRDRERY